MKVTVKTVTGYALVVFVFLLLSFLGNEATTAIAQRIPMERGQTIIIDPGHGGEDGGAVSVTGEKESIINLQISKRLNDLLHLLGYHTHMIRTGDESVSASGNTVAARKASDLKSRVRTVNETENGLLVSIHQNTFPQDRYSGAQIFYAPDGESEKLAEMLQSAFIASLNPGSNRSAKKADGIYLMQNIRKPGVLIECGFLSNHQEEALLRSKEYQQKICCVIAATLGQFLTE